MVLVILMTKVMYRLLFLQMKRHFCRYQTLNRLPQQQLINLLRQQPCHIDELIEKSRLDNSVVSATLSLLEINGAVHHLGGLVYTLS